MRRGPCINCEDKPKESDSLFCSVECKEEFEGIEKDEKEE